MHSKEAGRRHPVRCKQLVELQVSTHRSQEVFNTQALFPQNFSSIYDLQQTRLLASLPGLMHDGLSLPFDSSFRDDLDILSVTVF